MKAKLSILVVIVALLLASLACSSIATPQLVGTATQINSVAIATTVIPAATDISPADTATSPADPDPFADKTYAIGEVVKLQDQSIILNSATFSGDLLTANFSIANTSTTDMLISSLLNFSAKKSDGLKLEQTFTDCGGVGDGVDGGLFAGQKKRGIICYQTGGVTDITIYYVPDPYGPVSVAWEVKK